MAIPQEIKDVERPKGTVIKYASGFYYVVKRTSVYKDGRRVPKDLGIIGKIIDGQYVPKDNVVLKNQKEIDIKNYGEVALFNKVSTELLEELKVVYDQKIAEKLYVIALLRACNYDLTNRDLKHEYDYSYLSNLYPDVSLSESTMPEFLEDIGAAYLRIEQFMRNRVSKTFQDTILVDGTLKSYNSENSMFSDWSRKGRVKGCKDFSILYSYDINTGEPISAKPYTGNMLDSTAFEDFIEHFKANNNLFIMDKGFWNQKDIDKIKENNTAKYIIPIKNNSKLITDNDLLNNYQILDKYNEDVILYNKKLIDNKIYYVFKNKSDSNIQEKAYLEKEKKKNSFNNAKYQAKLKEFGVVIFESNYDTDPIEIYKAYESRWNIELMFKFYKNVLDITTTSVHNDYRVYGTEFINYLSLIISSKVKKELDKHKLLEKYSFKQIMRYLSKYKKCRVFDNRQEWKNNKLLGYISDIVKVLDI